MKSKVPSIVSNYFGTDRDITIAEVYTEHNGWTNQRNPRVSISGLRRLRAAGAKRVAFRFGNRIADFSIREVL